MSSHGYLLCNLYALTSYLVLGWGISFYRLDGIRIYIYSIYGCLRAAHRRTKAPILIYAHLVLISFLWLAGHLWPFWGHLGTILGQLGAILGRFRVTQVRGRRNIERKRRCQANFAKCARRSSESTILWFLGAILGPSWGHLGAILGHLGAILAPSWAILEPS